MTAKEEFRLTKVFTPGMKRRAVVKVIKSALLDAQRDTGDGRVVGIFGVVIKEDGTANLLSAVTVDELRIVMKAIPEALHAVSQSIVKGAKGRGN